MQAPPELWHGVSTQLLADKLGKQVAPDQLWDDVHARLEVEGLTAKQTKVFSMRPAFAAAAALLVVLGVAFQLDWTSSSSAFNPQLAPVLSAEAKAEIRSRVAFVEVQPSEMSSTAQSLATSLGGAASEVAR